MPEGDTIFRAARALQQALTGKQVNAFESAYAPLIAVHDNTPLTGRTIEQVESRGKWLLMHFSGDLILATHMRMSGSWHIYRHGESWKRGRAHMRIVIATADIEAVAFDVPVAHFYTPRTLERNTLIPQTETDLLQKNFAPDDARSRLRAQADAEIGNALLNQQVMAGIGNVFKSEICFVCGIHPFRSVASLSDAKIDALVTTAQRMLAANVQDASGDRIVTYTGPRRTTRAADQRARLWVYGRQGQACRRCGTAILMRKQGIGARSTYWCPQCQHSDTPVAGWATPVPRRKASC